MPVLYGKVALIYRYGTRFCRPQEGSVGLRAPQGLPAGVPMQRLEYHSDIKQRQQIAMGSASRIAHGTPQLQQDGLPIGW